MNLTSAAGRFFLMLVIVALTACAEDGPDRVDGTGRSRPASADEPAWPSTENNPAAGSCVYRYPDDLEDRAIAFDGTIVDVARGAYDDDAGAAPVDLELRVHEVFRGDLADVVTMHTWDFMLPRRDVTGIRVLAAAGPTMDLMGCGFTRPYSPEGARDWRAIFSS